MKKIFIYSSVIIFTLGVLSFAGIILFFSSPPSNGEEVVEVITIKPGSSLNQLSRLLQEKGVIRNQTFFYILARLRRVDTRIKFGEYQLSNRMFSNEVLNKIIQGKQIEYSITIPEGLTLLQIADLYSKKGLADKNKFIRMATDSDFAASLDINEEILEGYLFPDTYKFIRDIGERKIIFCMVQRFKEVYDKKIRERTKDVNLSQRKVVTLASMIEKETANSEEKKLISAVFHNRLKKNMRLQCDPTVIYGLDHFTGKLTKKDLKIYTPYNTYLIDGLPPAPISNPGIDSIRAVLYPAEVDYLYFVSKNDGTHYFSTTLSEHNQAVNKYQRSARRSKSP